MPRTDTKKNNQTLDLLRSWDWKDKLRSCRERAGEIDAELILGWHEIEHGDLHSARERLEKVAADPCFSSWAAAGLAAVAMRMKEYDKAHKHLDSIHAK